MSKTFRLIFLVFMLTPLHLNASVAQGVKIVRVHMLASPAPSGGVYITINGSRSTDNCPGNDFEFYIDLNEQPRGAMLYSHAMTAFKENYSVNIFGSDQCGGTYNVEMIKDFQVFK
jgi:hypothetical protein